MIQIIKKVIYKVRTILLLKIRNINIGSNATFSGKIPIIRNNGNLVIGNNFRVRSFQHKTEFGCGFNANLIIGNNVFLNQGTMIWAEKSIKIGNNVKIGDLTSISDTNFHEIDEGGGVKVKSIQIEDNVWIGRGVIILPGVEIGKNSVIGSGSVVTSSVPSNSLAAGNPSRIIRRINCSDNFIRS